MKKWILLFALLACSVVYVFEQVLEVNYGIKTGLKWVVFIFLPLLLLRKFPRENIETSVDKRGMLLGVLFGVISFSIVLLAYTFLKDFIDFDAILNEMKEKSGITPGNFILIGLYITFGNSFIEEFFFRGVIFLNLYREGHKKLAYFFSAGLFAVYHVAIFQSWFEPIIMLLALIGLFSVGLLFNWLNTKTNTFVNSWIVHIFADTAIILIGCKLLGIF